MHECDVMDGNVAGGPLRPNSNLGGNPFVFFAKGWGAQASPQANYSADVYSFLFWAVGSGRSVMGRWSLIDGGKITPGYRGGREGGWVAVIPQEVVPFGTARLKGGAYPRLPWGRAKL